MTPSSREPTRPDIRIDNPDGSASVQEVLIGTFYFRTPHSMVRDEVAECIRRFHALAPSGSLEYYFDYDGDQQDLDEAVLANVLYERFYSPDSFPSATLIIEGGGVHAPGWLLHHAGSALDNPDLPLEAGSLQLWLPRSFFSTRRADVLGFLADAAARLPVSCGSVSLGLAGENRLRKQALAARHPGLDISDPRAVSTDLGDQLAGIGWHTLLGAPMVGKLGGAVELRRALPGIVVEPLPLGGCRLVMGGDPEIGDVNRHELLPQYRAVARFFHDAGVLHVPEQVVYFVDRNGMADPDAMETWHRRFLDEAEG
jgi:hypothetical protein